jgi:hypothetical protein
VHGFPPCPELRFAQPPVRILVEPDISCAAPRSHAAPHAVTDAGNNVANRGKLLHEEERGANTRAGQWSSVRAEGGARTTPGSRPTSRPHPAARSPPALHRDPPRLLPLPADFPQHGRRLPLLLLCARAWRRAAPRHRLALSFQSFVALEDSSRGQQPAAKQPLPLAPPPPHLAGSWLPGCMAGWLPAAGRGRYWYGVGRPDHLARTMMVRCQHCPPMGGQ